MTTCSMSSCCLLVNLLSLPSPLPFARPLLASLFSPSSPFPSHSPCPYKTLHCLMRPTATHSKPLLALHVRRNMLGMHVQYRSLHSSHPVIQTHRLACCLVHSLACLHSQWTEKFLQCLRRACAQHRKYRMPSPCLPYLPVYAVIPEAVVGML
jgi:hypothetical protein